MTAPRRRVRASPDFFRQLDQQLPQDRDGSGRPTRAEFEAFELLKVIDQFETGWDGLPEMILGRPEYRILIATSGLVPAYSVVGQLAPDGAVELITVELDFEPPW